MRPLESTATAVSLGSVAAAHADKEEAMCARVMRSAGVAALRAAVGARVNTVPSSMMAEVRAGNGETAMTSLAGEVADDEAPANFTLMMLVGMTDPGLIILPTHRLISGLDGVKSELLVEILSPHFDIVERNGTDAKAAWDYIQMDGSQSVIGFCTVADGKWFVAKLRDTKIMAELAPDQSEEWRGLGVSILHKLVIDRLLQEKLGGRPLCRYVHMLKEVTDDVAAKGCQVATLVPPATMAHVEQIAGHLEKMPAKSTYFYPKLLTGVVYNSLKKD